MIEISYVKLKMDLFAVQNGQLIQLVVVLDMRYYLKGPKIRSYSNVIVL